jgi:alpha-1,3-rhamnosyl/mannosyltransferase
VHEPSLLPSNLGRSLLALPLILRRLGLDAFHAPAYTGPLWGATPTVLTIHDVSYARHPEWYPYRRDPARRAFYRASATRAARVITDSAFSREEIVAAYGIPRDRVVVIPLGVAPTFFAPDGVAPGPMPGPAPYVLHVGDLHRRRNLGGALSAVVGLRRRVPALRGLRLCLVGVDRGEAAGLLAQARDAGDGEALELKGPASEPELIALYRGASAFVYPSRYEGFGLPVLEAMASGTAVVAARAGAIPEVGGDAVLLVEPDDAGALERALERVLMDAGERSRLVAAGVARAASFTWARTARLTAAVYRALLAGGGAPASREPS